MCQMVWPWWGAALKSSAGGGGDDSFCIWFYTNVTRKDEFWGGGGGATTRNLLGTDGRWYSCLICTNIATSNTIVMNLRKRELLKRSKKFTQV